VVLPNIWTEVDNLLNDFNGNYKEQYVANIKEILNLPSEKYIESQIAIESDCFYDLGLTDSLILYYSKECKLLITSDSTLSDYAIAYGVSVYDMVKRKNEKLLTNY
jgi:hypothetical protein